MAGIRVHVDDEEATRSALFVAAGSSQRLSFGYISFSFADVSLPLPFSTHVPCAGFVPPIINLSCYTVAFDVVMLIF